MKIEEFVQFVTTERKRTGIALLNTDRSDFLSDFEKAGVKVVDLSANFSGQVIVADNVLTTFITERAIGAATCFVNIELYIGPRYEETSYLKYMVPMLRSKEPLQPIFFVFYSKLLYEKFKSYYRNFQPTKDHFYEEDF